MCGLAYFFFPELQRGTSDYEFSVGTGENQPASTTLSVTTKMFLLEIQNGHSLMSQALFKEKSSLPSWPYESMYNEVLFLEV